jgi:hypothetical protein
MFSNLKTYAKTNNPIATSAADTTTIEPWTVDAPLTKTTGAEDGTGVVLLTGVTTGATTPGAVEQGVSTTETGVSSSHLLQNVLVSLTVLTGTILTDETGLGTWTTGVDEGHGAELPAWTARAPKLKATRDMIESLAIGKIVR